VEIQLEGIVIIVGNYGSGKTEVAINLAANRKKSGLEVRMADLDLVNPYFRTREAKEQLARLGIELVIPETQFLQADLPILVPAVAGMIRHPSQLTIIDAGGDGAGVTVLATLTDELKVKEINVIQVVNPFRPRTDSVAGCLKIKDDIETSSKLMVKGVIGNANLIEETTLGHLYEGYDFMQDLSQKSGLNLEFVTVPVDLMPNIDQNRFSCPILPIERQLVPPWKKAVNLTGWV